MSPQKGKALPIATCELAILWLSRKQYGETHKATHKGHKYGIGNDPVISGFSLLRGRLLDLLNLLDFLHLKDTCIPVGCCIYMSILYSFHTFINWCHT
jgi:hypothetical protein